MRAPRGIRWLVRLLPFEIREAHGREMEQVLRDSYAERRAGRAGVLRFWLHAVFDMIRIAPRQHAEVMMQDLRYAVRTFRAAPVFTITAVATIALAIGAATAMFAVVNAVLLRPLPFAAPDRIAIVWTRPPDAPRTWLSIPELDDVRERVRALESVAGLSDLKMVLTGAGDPEELEVIAASANLGRVLGTTPLAGRWFDAAEDVPNGPAVVVLGESLWRTRFSGSPEVVGATVILNGSAHTVVGVVPRAFRIPPPSSVFPADVDAWVPLRTHVTAEGRDIRMLHAVGLLSPGATLTQAQEQALAAGRDVASRYPEYRGGAWTFEVSLLHEDLVRNVRPALLVLLVVVLVVVVIACANVAALLLARGTSRQREMAVRAALGASPARLARQMITEAVVLAAAGGAAGVVLARAAVALSSARLATSVPMSEQVVIDWQVALFAAGATLVTGVLFALAPVLASRGGAARDALRSRGRHQSAVRAGRTLAVAEISLACTVLVIALLLTRAFGTLLQVDAGFRTDSLITFRISLPAKYSTPGELTAFFDGALQRIEAAPGVVGAAAVTQLPLSGASLGSSFLLGPGEARRVDADFRGVTPQYFAVMGIAVVEGRALSDRDGAGAVPVAVVDEQFARRAWPGEAAVGKRIRWFRDAARELEVVGVVRSVRHRGFDAPARETVYRPHAQHARSTMFVVARVAGDPASVAGACRQAVRDVDPDQPIADVSTMDALAGRALAQPGLGAWLSSAFAALALLLTMVGTYGLFAFAVSQRRREVGVRLAIGATPGGIVHMILREGWSLALVGLAIGIPAAALAGNAARTSLGLSVPLDVPTFVAACAAIALSTSLACWIPARRAARVSPAEPLRSE